jgi:hypothetical protein
MLTLQRALPGRRVGGKCARPSRRLRQNKRCTRYRTIARLERSATSGANSVRFTGRLHKRALRPGRYRALITAQTRPATARHPGLPPSGSSEAEPRSAG